MIGRYFPFLMGPLLAILPGAAAAQSPADAVPRVGVMTWASCEPAVVERLYGPFLKGLEELGHRPGETLAIECRSADGRHEGHLRAAAELAAMGVDVIVGNAQPMGRAARQATSEIPIVSIVSGDPVSAGLAESLARPGGNLTGLSYYHTELTAKRLELLKEMLPEVARIGVLANRDVSDLPFEDDTRRAAGPLGLELIVQYASDPAELPLAFSRFASEGAEAVFVLPDLMLGNEAAEIARLALEHELPSMAWGGWFARLGCLMAYSSVYDEMVHRLAFYVDQILKGAQPGDLPIEQPTKFDLSINFRTAEALGLVVPETLLLLADEIIE